MLHLFRLHRQAHFTLIYSLKHLSLSRAYVLSLAVPRCTLSAQEEEESFMALTAQSVVSLETKPSAVAAHGNWGPVESSIRAKMAV